MQKRSLLKARAKYRVQEAMQGHRPTKEAAPAKPKTEQKAAVAVAPTQPLTVKGFSQATKSVSPAEAADRAQMKVYEKQMNVWIDKKRGARSQERYKEYDARFQDAKKKYYAIADKYADADEEKEVIAAVPKDKESPTAVFDTLKPEDQEWIKMWAKEIKHLPQALREAEMSELNKYGHKGSLLKERIAMQHVDRLKNPLPPEPGSTEPMGGSTAEAMRARMQQ